MTDADRGHFAMLLQGLATNFRAELTDATLAVTWLALRDLLSLSQMEAATRRALLECEYMPNVGKLLELAGVRMSNKLRVIDGKPYTWLSETGWGEYHGPIREAAASVGMRLEDVEHGAVRALLEGKRG